MDLPNYPGGKGGSGTYQKIINQLPPHSIYVEGFFGGGSVMSRKRPAPAGNYGIEIDIRTIGLWGNPYYPTLIHGDFLRVWKEHPEWNTPNTLLYLDPPYLLETRRRKDQLYLFDMGDSYSHSLLLDLIVELRCMVAISGYWSSLYAKRLASWRHIHWLSVTRGGKQAKEYLWMNYPVPVELHEYTYLGDDYRERERIKRKKKRWVARLQRLNRLERYALLSAIEEYKGAA